MARKQPTERERLFVGRKAEQDEFDQWVSAEPAEAEAGRGALLIGPSATGGRRYMGGRRYNEACNLKLKVL